MKIKLNAKLNIFGAVEIEYPSFPQNVKTVTRCRDKWIIEEILPLNNNMSVPVILRCWARITDYFSFVSFEDWEDVPIIVHTSWLKENTVS